jgi:hypothetical protein
MAVLLPGKFLCLGTPKTGSTCIHHALGAIPRAKVFNQHLRRFVLIEENMGPYQGEHTFLVVRNVYDLMVSWWLRSRTGMSLAEYRATYDNKHFVEDGRLFWLVEDGMEILRYENLQQELDAVLARLGIEPRPLPFLNATRNKRPCAPTSGRRRSARPTSASATSASATRWRATGTRCSTPLPSLLKRLGRCLIVPSRRATSCPPIRGPSFGS